MPYDIFFPQTQSALAVSHTQTHHTHTYRCRHKVCSSSFTQSAHRQICPCTITHIQRPPAESQSLFPQTILHCFLQSPNWLYPDPAHRPESETIKNSIYIPAVSTWAPTACDYTHQPSSSVCDFKLRAVFHIYLNVALLESFAA